MFPGYLDSIDVFVACQSDGVLACEFNPTYLDVSVYSFLQTSELGITEHIAEDPCKFAVWTGEPPFTEDKRIIKVTILYQYTDSF